MIYGYDLNSLIAQGRAHWREHLPAKFKALEAAGTLEQALRLAASLTRKEMDLLMAGGMTTYEAWEQCRENHLILPEEPDSDPEEPDSPAFDTLAEWNALQDKMAIEEDGNPAPRSR